MQTRRKHYRINWRNMGKNFAFRMGRNFWTILILIHFAMLSSTADVTTIAPVQQEEVEESVEDLFAWSSWGSWSACSRTCGGGVSVQERQCLPRVSREKAVNTTVSSEEVTGRVTRQATSSNCVGVDKRYHECNTAPCLGGEGDFRVEQCSSYNRRPFRGQFYTWIPYVNGDFPCTLNCRPLGHQFYATLALVADGTPCTRPGFRAICVQGTCKVVGREGVLAVTGSREARCGRRLVSGLFSRPRLPLGYSYVTTVPRGACRLNVSEIIASENFIALKISNSSYIMNGEFAVSAPGVYEAAGARFIYTRTGGLDSVFALGPIQHPIDIMILYTQPNPSIRYAYFTESQQGKLDSDSITKTTLLDGLPSVPSSKHTRRHHSFESIPKPSMSIPSYPNVSKEKEGFEEKSVGGRKFVWKILSFTQCSRTCGGGIQVGKFRCTEVSSGFDKEVSSVHCASSPPAARRRRCGGNHCPPRWRAAAWSTCPQCGPASRTRIVGCVQDHARVITKISDQKCPAPKPATTEICEIPNCSEVKQFETKRVIRPRDHIDAFHDGPVYSISVNTSDIDVGPSYSFNGAAVGWLYSEWSECVGWCVGGGVRTRGVGCADPSGCAPRKTPETSSDCTPTLSCEPHEGQWFTGEWSPCSSQCGRQIRGVLCIGGSGRHLKDSACKGPRPVNVRDCEENCTPDWYFSDWNLCMGNCSSGIGVQRRTVWCARGAGGGEGQRVVEDKECVGSQPPAQRSCTLKCQTTPTFPPDLSIESQKTSENEITDTEEVASKESKPKDCEDKLSNCGLAVQARLCNYKYYINNCCYSCKGR